MTSQQPPGSWERITTALESKVGPGRRSGAWTQYCCPSHEGDGRAHKPSLGVKYDDRQHRTVVRCFAGCENEHVLEAVGLEVRDLFDRRLDRAAGRGRSAYRPRPAQRPASRSDRALEAAGLPPKQPTRPDLGRRVSPWKQVDTYPYLRADGTVAGEVFRKEAQFERGRDKDFGQRRWNPASGEMEPGGFEPLPYQLPQVLETIAEGGVVYIVEGEKDVHSAVAAGLTATTNVGGAVAWTAEHSQWLQGAGTVVIVADHDTAGYRRADRVMSTLSGLVGRVRVVQAATGKDLTDHLMCGHDISELVPIPHLDPYTPGPAAVAAAVSTPAAETSAVSAAPSADPAISGGSVPEYLLATSGDVPQTHSDEVDSISGSWSTFMRLFMTQLTEMARKQAEKREHAARVAREKSEREAEELAIRHAAERAAVEVRLRKLAEAGLDNASRTQLAEAVVDAAAWREDSQVAAQVMTQLSHQVQQRFGVRIDPVTGEVIPATAAEATAGLAGALMGAESDRAAAARLATAQKRMVELVADTAVDDDRKAELYAAIETWRAHPSAKALTELTKVMDDKGVPEKVRTQARFVAVYIGRPGDVVPMADLAQIRAVQPTAELRKLPEALVDPGEEVKPRVDELLARFQDRVKLGAPTESIRTQLSEAIAVMTPEDQAAARDRGLAITKAPTQEFPALWPDHVDRDELATKIRMYATLAPQAELAAGKAGDLDDAAAAGLMRQAAKHRGAITKALKSGKGLHEYERDQISAVLRDIEAGKTQTPDMLFADDRSAAAVDADRATHIARDTSYASRRQAEQLLKSNMAPEGTVRRARTELGRVMDAQTELGRGHGTLSDYERLGLDQQLGAKLAAVGVPEPLRNKVANHLDSAAGESASAGKSAQRIADRWAQRRDAVVVARSVAGAAAGAAGPDYDGPERRADLERDVRAAGVSEDSVAQRMAADAGRARPPSAAVRNARGGQRRTSPGAGVSRTQHRGRNGRGPEKGLGR
ncbi:toprim domain-containing protein (plasmid) [Nocardia sp. PE-7]|uniref:toprim domain-containing protein n=1 Tax=Nocardia sp. PE-7 TaxID=3058426 RepID=UPI002657C197|nr:toprim domain-containing protein [Nocardia sp. PE-7]WKG13585.1 toprim domain-containing protein [Nocardia sp. PE-7]